MREYSLSHEIRKKKLGESVDLLANIFHNERGDSEVPLETRDELDLHGRLNFPESFRVSFSFWVLLPHSSCRKRREWS